MDLRIYGVRLRMEGDVEGVWAVRGCCAGMILVIVVIFRGLCVADLGVGSG